LEDIVTGFLNLFGEAVNATPPSAPASKRRQPRTRRVERHDAATISRGFMVTGVAPEGCAKRRPMRPAPYALREAAEQCAEMARRAGWRDVRVDELLSVETGPAINDT
jgi:hypothetical protein